MRRRDFIRNSSVIGIAAAAFPNIITYPKTHTDNSVYDLVAIKGGEPDAMFLRAMNDMGGMKRFVKPNQTVVVKPNIGWDVTPERAANTNPKLVYRIIKECYNAGAKQVYVFDHTCDNWTRCYTNSGIERSAIDAGAKVVPGNTEGYYHDVEIKQGRVLKKAKVHELILESDVFINVPILKNHDSATLTVAMKNLMGIVWDRGYWHRNDLHRCIADFASFRNPDLNIVDAYNVMKRNGPRGVSTGDVVSLKSQIISTDLVACDAAAAKLFGSAPESIEHIVYADEMKLGTMNLSSLNISRIIL